MESSLAARLERSAGKSTLQLVHHGRKSGKPYEVTIWFMVDGEKVYLATMSLKRQWTRNVLVRPQVELKVDGERFTGTVAPVTEAAEISHVVELLKRKYWLARPYLWLKGKPDGAFRVQLEG